ncbi:acid protease [Butyriboletus roseoflavus]|nr:acid protease [Butyriboletus roseoflavus]
MRSLVALSVVFLAASVSASSIFTVPLTKFSRPRMTGNLKRAFRAHRRARVSYLKTRTTSGQTTAPATNIFFSGYTTRVGIGNPPTYYNLVVDTGSSNTWCGASSPYVRTPTSIDTGEAVNVTYWMGNFSGEEYLDQVTLAPNLVLNNQSIGDALSYHDMQGFDGILGLGPVDLTLNSLSPDRNETIPTVMNNLVSQGFIKNQVLGVYFAPATNSSDTNGALTYGGADSSLYRGELTYVPMTDTYPASSFWGINVTLAMYGTDVVIPASTTGVIDTGTTQLLLADNFFSAYVNAIPGATLDSTTGLLEIPTSSIPLMQPLNFTMADRVFTMDVAAQLFPSNEDIALGGVAGKQYGVVGSLGYIGVKGFGFVLGVTFMERYYAVFDADASRVGFAQT